MNVWWIMAGIAGCVLFVFTVVIACIGLWQFLKISKEIDKQKKSPHQWW